MYYIVIHIILKNNFKNYLIITYSRREIPEILICILGSPTWNYLCINVKYFIIIVQHIMAWINVFLSVLFGNSGGSE